MKRSLTTLSLVLALAAGTAYAVDAPQEGAQEHGHMLKETDTNNDGAVSKDEWRAKGDKMFSEIDANGDSKISTDEMKAHHKQMREKRTDRREAFREKMQEHKAKREERLEKVKEQATPVEQEAH